MLHTVCPEKRD